LSYRFAPGEDLTEAIQQQRTIGEPGELVVQGEMARRRGLLLVMNREFLQRDIGFAKEGELPPGHDRFLPTGRQRLLKCQRLRERVLQTPRCGACGEILLGVGPCFHPNARRYDRSRRLHAICSRTDRLLTSKRRLPLLVCTSGGDGRSILAVPHVGQ